MENDQTGDTDKTGNANRALKIRGACLDHARDLVAAAERVIRDRGFPNIAYHLAILALEEIGKAGMVSCRAVVGGRRDTDWMDISLKITCGSSNGRSGRQACRAVELTPRTSPRLGVLL
jgi:hypothetical protein